MEKIVMPQDQIPVLRTIRGKFSQMTQLQQQIARYILDQPARVIKMSITQLTRATDVKSESAIVRFYKALGFPGYHDFKVNLATEIAGKSFYYTYEDITENDNVETVKEKIFQGTRILQHCTRMRFKKLWIFSKPPDGSFFWAMGLPGSSPLTDFSNSLN
jgi:DNA-binding MurR/RpiR family transcriptional regulator